MGMGRTTQKNAPNPAELTPVPNLTVPNHDGWVLSTGPSPSPPLQIAFEVAHKLIEVAVKQLELLNRFEPEFEPEFKPRESKLEPSRLEPSRLELLRLVKRKVEEFKDEEQRLKELESAAPPTPSPTPGCESTLVPSSLGHTPWWKLWSFSLSGLYQFSNQRSRVGNLSWNINSAGIDFTAAYDYCPYTTLDFLYLYSHFNGSMPGGANDATNQHLGSVRILQPLNPIWFDDWRPADQSAHKVNQQLAALLRATYGGSIGSLEGPNSAFRHDNNNSFVGDALLDYQFAWFPCRVEGKPEAIQYRPQDKTCPTYSYPSLLLELGSGMEFSTQQFDSTSTSSAISTSGRQVNYLNFASLTYSFPCRWGLLVGVQWNAPLDSRPVHGGKADYANTATFTSGLVYNLYPYTNPGIQLDGRRFSLALLYSYTAFDPLSETNTLQLQISYSF